MAKRTSEPSEYKTIPAFVEIKTTDDEDKGIVDHLVSVYGVLDLGGDVCHPGCFTKTLQERKGEIRVLDAHQRGSILNILGIPLDLKEVDRNELPAEVLEKFPEATGGLVARTQFLLNTPEGKGAFLRIKSGAVSQFSFGYNTLDEDFDTLPNGKEIRNLRTLKLWEYSPVLFAMNPAALVTGVKDAEPGEEKPAPDVTENTIRMRVRDPGDFQEDSFRTISIDKSGGIQAVIGRLEGETSTTVQSYIFDKDKWTVERARKWVSEHKKAFVIFVSEVKEEEPGGPDKCECPKCGHKVDKERGTPCRSMKCPKCGTKLVAEEEAGESESQGDQDDQGKLLEVEIELEQVQMLLDLEAGPAV